MSPNKRVNRMTDTGSTMILMEAQPTIEERMQTEGRPAQDVVFNPVSGRLELVYRKP